MHPFNQPISLKIGQKLTIFYISTGLAHTCKSEIAVASVLETPMPRCQYQNGPVVGYRLGTCREKGKRKELPLVIHNESLVFDGWDLPIVTDYEVQRDDPGSRVFTGNACFNLGAPDEATLRDFIENRNLNLLFPESAKATCLYIPSGSSVDAEGIILYPEIHSAHSGLEDRKHATIR
jgi:hypothetical protein